jgi:hypothetical protein
MPTMFAYRDFTPAKKTEGSFWKGAQYEDLDAAVAEANEWVRANRVRVLNVETVLLPNIESADNTSAALLNVTHMNHSTSAWHQFVRVWYERTE